MKHLSIIFTLIFILLVSLATSQDKIFIQNPSFEANLEIGEEKIDTNYTVRGWASIEEEGNTPPDIFSIYGNKFGIKKLPFDGNYFMGMVTRQDSSYESIFQNLSQPIKKGKKYKISIYLCASDKLLSFARLKDRSTLSKKPLNFNNGAVFRIQGSNSETKACQVLATSKTILNNEWEKYDFVLEPNAEYDILVFEAYYDTSKLENQICNANILLGNCSPLIEIID